MSKTEVVCVSSRIPDPVREPYYRYDVFLRSLEKLGVAPVVLGMNEPWHGLMTKPNHFRTWLRAGLNPTSRIIICDSWDIVFAEHPDSIGQRCEDLFGDTIVFNGEKGCWPRAELADKFPDQGTPWRYLNSGFMCGPAENILYLLESMELERIGVDRKDGNRKIEPNDQGEFQYAFTCQPVPMVVDGKCQLAQTLSACTMDEFDLIHEDRMIFNKITGTYPGVFHFNGDSKNLLMPAFMTKLGL